MPQSEMPIRCPKCDCQDWTMWEDGYVQCHNGHGYVNGVVV